MAVIASAINSLQLVVDEEVASLQLNQYPVLNRVQKKVAGQKVIKWNANVGGATVTGEATTADVSTFSEDSVVSAQLAIGTNRLRHSFQVQKEDIEEAKNAGRGALRDLFGYEVQSGVRAILEVLSGYIYSGTGLAAQGGVVGMGAAVAAAAYAGIDPATYTLWAPYLNTNGTNRALTAALLQTVETGIATKGSNFTAIYTSPTIVAAYKALFATSVLNPQLNNGIADLGFSGVSYAGRPIIQDPYCTANAMYFVNESEVTLYTYGQSNTQNNNGMQFAVEQLPSSNPDALKYAIYVKPQLQVKTRNKGIAGLLAIQ
ncbi:phage major capsid protein [Nostoc sp. UIC 10630]|uniref:phage major capsid protein n=1 Tax=Nostoc sp. UIC 10630 TaxID=2100146 RepID=UPI0013D13471|nr:phage major capsid protein [Nostoc sp. UIC 10630]NEU81490.1 phage major capsid protein [Nostoc sp. UIC 10630]